MDIKKLSLLKKNAEQDKATSEELKEQIKFSLSQNNNSQAYQYLIQLLDKIAPTAELFNNAGLMALALNKNEEAKEHFLKALKINNKDYQANYNLALLHTMNNQPQMAIDVFENLSSINPDDVSLLNDIAVLQMNNGKKKESFQLFRRALTKEPNNDTIRNNALELATENNMTEEAFKLLEFNLKQDISESSRANISDWQTKIKNSSRNIKLTSVKSTSKKKLAFFAVHRTFLKDIIEILSKSYEIKIFEGNKVEEIYRLMEWADIAWFEWCDQLLIHAASMPKCCKIICRLHSYEAFTEMPSKVDWNKVDKLIFVNQSVKSVFEQQCQTNISKEIIYNGIDMGKYPLRTVRNNGKKIASVGYINYKKNPTLLLYSFKKIYEYDNEYTLHIAGTHQDPRIQLYFDHFLRENQLPVQFYGWVEDMPVWYKDKDFVISSSLFESFHYSIAEGMASGLMPLIHNWYGAANLYPTEYLYNDPDDCLKLLKKLEKEDMKKLAEENRAFIQQHFDKNTTNEMVKETVDALAHESLETTIA